MIQRPLPCFSQYMCYCNLPLILEFQPAMTKLHQVQACEHEKRTNNHKCVNAQGSILSKSVGICGWKGEYQHDISSWREDRLAVDDGNPLTVLLLMLSATNQPWTLSIRVDVMVFLLLPVGCVLPHHISLTLSSGCDLLQRHSSGGEVTVKEGAESIRVGDTGLYRRCDLLRHTPFPPEWWEEGIPQQGWKTFWEILVSVFLASVWAFST